MYNLNPVLKSNLEPFFSFFFLRGTSDNWFSPFFKTEIPFFETSNNDHKVMFNSAKANNKACIKTIMNRTRETMKYFCQIKQILHETNDLISCDYYDIDELINSY